MKIVLFIPGLNAGGAEQVSALLSKGLVAEGHQVIVATPSMGVFVKRFREGVRIVNFNTKKPIRSLKSLADLVGEELPDAMICFGMVCGISACMSRLLFGWDNKIIVRIENNIEMDWKSGDFINKLVFPFISRWVARNARLVVVSKSLLIPTCKFLRKPVEDVRVILNPVFNFDDQESESEYLHPWLGDDLPPVFVAVGRLEFQKGFDTLIEAFLVIRKRVEARLIIFGEGSLKSELQSKIDDLGLAESILLAGFVDNPMYQMKNAHAFVLSSRYEGFGLVLVEALLSGTKVISTDCAYGPRELLEDGRYGCLVPVEDVESLAEAMFNSLKSENSMIGPTEEWFNKFTAVEVARQHIDVIKEFN